MRRSTLRLFGQDPELFRNVSRWDQRHAREAAAVAAIELAPGEWSPPLVQLRDEDLGLLVLEGLIVRRVHVAGRCAVELLGSGDVARPWSRDREVGSIGSSVLVEVAEPTLVALLDRDFVRAISRWPQILPQILERMSVRTTSLAFQLAIARLPSLELRLLCELWHLADRWGFVCRDGVQLRLRLSQRLLADLTSAGRQAVNTALGRLRDQGLVERSGPRLYKLHGSPPGELDELRGARREQRSTCHLDQLTGAVYVVQATSPCAETSPGRLRQV